jgi:hypothetical protein
VGAFVLSGLFGYLWLVYRRRSLALWTIAWTLWFLRLAYGVAVGTMDVVSSDGIPRTLAMAYTTFVLLGAAEFSGRRVLPWWLALAVPALLLRIGTPGVGHPQSPQVLFYALVLGSGWVWAGVLFGRADSRMGPERWIPAVALCLMGAHQMSIPWVGDLAGYEPWALAITLALQIAIGVGVLAAFGRVQRVEIREAHAALDRALTQVLSGYIPICSGCKSIRDEGERWVPIETYLGRRTEASLSHGICPVCMAKLYPEYLDDRDLPPGGRSQ